LPTAFRLDFLGNRWRGFRIAPDCIESPEGDFVRCEEIRALRYAMQALDIDRFRRYQMNSKNEPEAFDFNKVTFIDNAPKQKTPRHLDGAVSLPLSVESQT